jgi:YVTN family beta-propeller protein
LIVAALCAAPCGYAANAYVSTEQGSIAVIDLDRLDVTSTFPTGGKGARGIAITADGRYLLVANRDNGDLSVLASADGRVVKRVPIGKNPEFVRISGNHAYVTNEPSERPTASGPASAAAAPQHGSDEALPARISVVDLTQWKVVRTITTGLETEGIEFSPDGRLLLVTNEGDDTVTVYDQASGRQVELIRMPKGSRPRGIKLSPDGRHYAVTLEHANSVLLLDARDYHVARQVPTGASPYGVAFDREGKRMLVAAARADTLQVFDTTNYENIASLPVGKRCWHFSFTPDDSRLLVACGRSDAVYVFDAHSYQPIRRIEGLKLNWGIVTNPKSSGSLDTP